MKRRLIPAALALVLSGLPAAGENWAKKGREAFDGGRMEEAVTALRKQIDLFPEHVESYKLLGQALEKLGRVEEAQRVWEDFRILAQTPEDRSLARERLGLAKSARVTDTAEFTLTEEEKKAIARIDVEWTTVETEHFTVRARNKALAGIVSRQAEVYLGALTNTFLGGTPYPHKVPLTIHPHERAWVEAGLPEWSQGQTSMQFLTMDQFLSGKRTRRIDLLQYMGERLNEDLTRPEVLPHELAHLVLMEYFSNRRMPLWLNEGIAQSVQGGRRARCDEEIGKILLASPDLVMRLPEVMALEGYPAELHKIGQFYALSASFTGWVLEKAGPTRMNAILSDIRNGKGADDAIVRQMKEVGFATFALMEEAWRKHALECAQAKK